MVVYDPAVQQPIVAHRYIVNIIMSTALQVDLCSSIETIPDCPRFADWGKVYTMGGIHSIDTQGWPTGKWSKLVCDKWQVLPLRISGWHTKIQSVLKSMSAWGEYLIWNNNQEWNHPPLVGTTTEPKQATWAIPLTEVTLQRMLW